MADKQKKSAGRSVASKALTIQEYKRRLRDNIKSLNDNFVHILESAKITSDESALKSTSGRMTEYYTVKNEMMTRAALMVRAADELTKLNNDLKEFLILCDFNFLSYAIENAQDKCELKTQEGTQKWNNVRVEVNKMISDIEFLMNNC